MREKSLIKNSMYNIIYTVTNILFPFLTSIYVSRILLPSGVGIVAYAQNIASYFVTFAALGLPAYGVREFSKVRKNISEKNKLFSELFIINMFSTTCAIVGFICIVVINAGFGSEWSLYGACGLSIVFNYLNIDWLYQGEEEYGYIAGRSLIIKIMSIGALIGFVKNQQDYVIYALVNSLAIGGNYLFNVWHARTLVRFEMRNLDFKKHIKPVVLIALIILLSSIYSKIDTTMLGMLATNEAVGYYTYAQKTVAIVLSMCSAVTATLLPRLSFYFDSNRQAFDELLNRGFQVLCLFAIPMCVGLFIVAPQVVEVLYGENFEPAMVTIRWLCPILLIKSFGDLFCYQLVYSIKGEKILVPAAVVASIFNIIANTFLIPILMHNGAVIASLLSELATNMIQFVYVKHKIKFQLTKKPFLTALWSTLLMSVFVIVIVNSELSSIASLFIGTIGGGVVYLLLNVISKNNILLETIQKIKNGIR